MTMKSFIKLLELTFLFGLIKKTYSLESVFLKIPEQYFQVGDDVTISCHYNLEDDLLYSIKWYKDGDNFMRYSPKDKVPIRGFPVVGVNLQEKLLRPYTITLKNVALETSGDYSCEVSADAPSYQTQIASARLTVHEDGDDHEDVVNHHYFSTGGLILSNIRFIILGFISVCCLL